jgi:hypothetical protein
MRGFLFFFVVLPFSIAIVVLAVANRGLVTFSLDPISAVPALSITAPLFVFLFATLALGVLAGGIAAWIGQGKWRRMARSERAYALRMQEEAKRSAARATALTAVPRLPASRDAA